MNDQEKEIQKYKEQGFKKKKKHQLAPEPEKYKIDEAKMIGSPDMLTEDERKKFTMRQTGRRQTPLFHIFPTCSRKSAKSIKNGNRIRNGCRHL